MGVGTRLLLGSAVMMTGVLGSALWAMRESSPVERTTEVSAPGPGPQRSAEHQQVQGASSSALRLEPVEQAGRQRGEGGPRTPMSIPQASSFDELVLAYAESSLQQLDDMLASIHSEIDRRGLIQKANADALSDTEREELRILLRRQNALYAVKTRHMLKSSEPESR